MKLQPLQSRSKKSASGMTLVETVFSTAASIVVLGSLMSLFIFFAKSFAAMSNYADLDRYSRTALDTITKDIRSAQYLVSWTNSPNPTLTLMSQDGANTFSYTLTTNALVRNWTNGTSSILLKGVDVWTVGLYYKSPVPNGGFSFYPVTNNYSVNTKLIDMSWKCSRQIFSTKINTESIQTAKVVMRI